VPSVSVDPAASRQTQTQTQTQSQDTDTDKTQAHGQVRILITKTQIDPDSDQNSTNIKLMACEADIDSHPDCRVRHYKGEDSADPSRQTNTQTQRQDSTVTHLVLSFPLSLFSLFLSLSF
jgi:hypothetical protein